MQFDTEICALAATAQKVIACIVRSDGVSVGSDGQKERHKGIQGLEMMEAMFHMFDMADSTPKRLRAA